MVAFFSTQLEKSGPSPYSSASVLETIVKASKSWPRNRLRVSVKSAKLAKLVIKVTGYSCACRAKCIEVHAEFSSQKSLGTKSVSNLILTLEVCCHKLQGMTEAFTDTV